MNFKYAAIITIIILCISCAGSPPSGHLSASGFFSKKVLIQTERGFYIRLDNSAEQVLIADAKNAVQADTFYFCDLGNHVCGLQAMNGKYIAANLAQNAQLTVHQVYIADWEKFFFYEQDGYTILQANANNFYIAPIDSNGQKLAAAINTPSTPNTHFKIIHLP